MWGFNKAKKDWRQELAQVDTWLPSRANRDGLHPRQGRAYQSDPETRRLWEDNL